jgi:hypothetical protein
MDKCRVARRPRIKASEHAGEAAGLRLGDAVGEAYDEGGIAPLRTHAFMASVRRRHRFVVAMTTASAVAAACCGGGSLAQGLLEADGGPGEARGGPAAE